MTHFALTALVPGHIQDTEGFLDSLLAPYSENLQVDPYRRYVDNFWMDQEFRKSGSLTAAEGDPDYVDQYVAAWNKRYPGEDELYLETETRQAYHLSTYNPSSKWDWWEIGGRYAGEWPSGNFSCPQDLLVLLDQGDDGVPTLAMLTPAGQWHERGRAGWWGTVHDVKERADWVSEYRRVLESHLDCRAVLLDLHI